MVLDYLNIGVQYLPFRNTIMHRSDTDDDDAGSIWRTGKMSSQHLPEHQSVSKVGGNAVCDHAPRRTEADHVHAR